MIFLPELRRLFLVGILFLFFSAGCSSPETKSQELYDTAQLEEQQNNLPHAQKLYREIVEKYSETAAAAKARDRLKSLEAQPAR
ncbi:MAG TPA: hypothetical protein VI382_01365 [Candidatus Manganitrophaceae bacterium]|nr:hypothetical protein [Candidatus Manganitrophaceae bacterium]